jgi:hypothetical protein
MVSALIAAGLIALPPTARAHDNDDRDDHHHGKGPGAAALADCCTPATKTSPRTAATWATSAIRR